MLELLIFAIQEAANMSMWDVVDEIMNDLACLDIDVAIVDGRVIIL